jgi:hypothetical protein
MGAQTTTRGHQDRACGNIVHPTERLADCPDEILFPQVCPDRIHVRNLEDQPPPVTHGMTFLQIEDGPLSLIRTE